MGPRTGSQKIVIGRNRRFPNIYLPVFAIPFAVHSVASVHVICGCTITPTVHRFSKNHMLISLSDHQFKKSVSFVI